MAQIAATHFESNLDHLAAELAVLDLHLSREEQKIRHDPGWDTDDQFRGLMVSDKQMETLLWGKGLEPQVADQESSCKNQTTSHCSLLL